MTITIEKTETIELDVQFPLYKKYGSSIHWIMDENNWVEVDESDVQSRKKIVIHSQKPAWHDLVLLQGIDVTPQQFNTAFMNVLDIINSKSPITA